MPQPSWKQIALLFVPGVLWGGAFVLTEMVLETIPPISYTMLRNIITAVALVAILYARNGRLQTTPRAWLTYFVIGFFNNALPFTLVNWGQLTIDSGLASILVSTMPFFTLLLAHFFTDDERLTPPKLLGIGLGLLGIVVLIGLDALSGLGGSLAGQLMVTGAAVSYAIGAILSRSYLRASRQRAVPPQLRALEIVTGQYAATAVLLILLAFTVEDPLVLRPSLRSITALLISALPVTITAVLVYYHLIDTIGASFSALSIYIIPIAGVLMGALLLGEPITPQVIIALVLILLGVAIVNGLFSWRKRPLVHSG